MADAAGELFLGSCCPGCGATGWSLCAGCARQLRERREVRWSVHGLDAVAACVYEGAWRSALVAYKERRAWSLSGPLGAALAWSVAGLSQLPAELVLVPVPSSASAVLERGEDVTWRLAVAASTSLRSVGVDARPLRLLRQRRAVGDQSGLDVDAREANLRGSLRAVGPQVRRPVVVVDDIATSGATLRESVRASRAAGLEVLGAAVVAATPRRDGHDTRMRRL